MVTAPGVLAVLTLPPWLYLAIGHGRSWHIAVWPPARAHALARGSGGGACP